MQAREWSETFKVLRERNHQPRILYPVKWPFKNEGEIKTLWDKQKLREFVASRAVLQEMLKKKKKKKFLREKENNIGQKLRPT